MAASTNQLQKTFDGKSTDYQAWKKHRLQLQDTLHSTAAEPFVISSTLSEKRQLPALCNHVRDHGFARYQWSDSPDDVNRAVKQLYSQLSLTRHDTGVVRDSDELSLLQDLSGTERGRFIPYTSKPMGWHTDGYYNDPAETLRSFTLHCISPAAKGGALSLLDYELVLIALYLSLIHI